MLASEYLKDADSVHLAMYAELAGRVGETLDTLKLLPEPDGNWCWPYNEYEWTEAEEKDFREWLTSHMYKNRGKLEMRYATKKFIKQEVVPSWMLMFSWRYKEKK